jgi:hypothetical protein
MPRSAALRCISARLRFAAPLRLQRSNERSAAWGRLLARKWNFSAVSEIDFIRVRAALSEIDLIHGSAERILEYSQLRG